MWERLTPLVETLPATAADAGAAVLAPLYEDSDGDVRLILTKRPDHMPTHPGDLAFPGGKVHPDDDDVVATALREAQEEIGLEPDEVEVLGFLPIIHTVAFARWVAPVVGRIEGEPALTADPNEVARILLPKLSMFLDEDRWVWQPGRYLHKRVWFFELEDEILWGATAFMVRQLVGLEE